MDKARKILAGVVLFIIFLAMIAALSGCTVTKQEDGGFGIKVGMTEEAHEDIQQKIDGATGVLGGLSSLFPALTPLAAAAGVGGLTWKRMKKTVTKNKAPLDVLVQSLEHVKANDAETWAKVKEQIRAQHPDANIRGTIDEIKAELVKQGKLAQA